MALDLEVTSLDGLDDAVKGLYVASGDNFKLDVLGLPKPADPPDNSGLKKALDSERGLLKAAKKELKDALSAQSKFDGVDIDQYNDVMAANLKAKEDALIADGKKDEVYASKLESSNIKWQAEIEKQQKLFDDANVEYETAKSRITDLQKKALNGAILNGISGVFHTDAIEDAVMLAGTMFVLNDKDEAVMTNDDGVEISPNAWAVSAKLREKKPHWYLSSGNGSGATQHVVTSTGAKTLTRSQYETLSPIEKRAAYKNGVKIVDD